MDIFYKQLHISCPTSGCNSIRNWSKKASIGFVIDIRTVRGTKMDSDHNYVYIVRCQIDQLTIKNTTPPQSTTPTLEDAGLYECLPNYRSIADYDVAV